MRVLMGFLLGSLLVGTILIGLVAAENFFMVDRLLESPAPAEFQEKIAPLSGGDARIVLRYLSSELNRFYFRVWGGAEILFGAVLLGLALRSGPKDRNDRVFAIGVGVMLGLSLIMAFFLTPQLVEIGRGLDFAAREPAPPELSRFGMLHGAYSALDLAQLGLGIWLTLRLVRRPSES